MLVIKKNKFIYVFIIFLGLPSTSSSYSDNCLISSSSQTTQVLSLYTPRKKKIRAELREMKDKYEQLEQKMNALSQEVAMKNSVNAIDVSSVELFNRVVEAHLPPNLCMIIKHYVQMSQRKPQGIRYSNQIKQLAIFFWSTCLHIFKIYITIAKSKNIT